MSEAYFCLSELRPLVTANEWKGWRWLRVVMPHFQTDALRHNTLCRQEHAEVSSTLGGYRRAKNERPSRWLVADCRGYFSSDGSMCKRLLLLLASERMLPALSCLQAAGRRRQAHHAVP